jgi:hypothetical protein
MNKENVVYVHNGILFSHKERKPFIFSKKDGTGRDYVKVNKSNTEREVLYTHRGDTLINPNSFGHWLWN